MRKYGYCSLFASLAIAGLFCICIGCDDDDDGVGPGSINTPSNPYPANRASNIPAITEFNWTYVDSVSDSVFFDFCIGKTSPPPILKSRLTDPEYEPGALTSGNKHYWRVIAYNNAGDSVVSPVWSFTTSDEFVHPLIIGNSWEYFGLYYNTNFNPDTLANLPMFGDTALSVSTAEVVRFDTLPNSIPVYVIHTVVQEEGSGFETDEYNNNTDSGFYMYAYKMGFGWGSPPKAEPGSGLYFEFKGIHASSPNELLSLVKSKLGLSRVNPPDTIYIEELPVRELAYPLEVGNSWMYRSAEIELFWDMEKAVVGIEEIEVPAGIFDCNKIQWYWDMDDNGQWDSGITGFDYASQIGVVRRYFHISDIIVSNEYGDSLGTFDIIEAFNLTNYEVK
jgi:hypothetical protein